MYVREEMACPCCEKGLFSAPLLPFLHSHFLSKKFTRLLRWFSFHGAIP